MAQNTTLLTKVGKSDGSCGFCSKSLWRDLQNVAVYDVRAVLGTTGVSN